MRTTHWLVPAILGPALMGCASIDTAPTPEVRQVLAPSGKLRVGLYLGGPVSVIRDSTSGEMKGVGFDLGKELARRMGVPFEPVVFPSVGSLVGGAKSGEWDVAFLAVSPERAKDMDFIVPHLELELGYLVPSGSSISVLADVDRPGVRVGVPDKSGGDAILSRTLRNATLVRTAGLAAGLETLKSGKADIFAGNKANLFEMSDQLPGSRVLAGRFSSVQHAMVIPKGRELGAAYVRKYIEEAKAEGLVKAAIERAGMRGAVVAPPQ